MAMNIPQAEISGSGHRSYSTKSAKFYHFKCHLTEAILQPRTDFTGQVRTFRRKQAEPSPGAILPRLSQQDRRHGNLAGFRFIGIGCGNVRARIPHRRPEKRTIAARHYHALSFVHPMRTPMERVRKPTADLSLHNPRSASRSVCSPRAR